MTLQPNIRNILCPYKRVKIPPFCPAPSPSSCLPTSELQRRKLQPLPPPLPFPAMVGSGSKGKWEASYVTEKDIKDLWSAGYLSADIAHRLPEKDQVLPTSKPGERVVFIPHFL